MTNFDYDHQVMNVVDSRARREQVMISSAITSLKEQLDFHWCGYAIDMKDLSVSADYTRYHNIGK